jgi:hypothetical protein
LFDLLGHIDLSLELLSLSLGGNRETTLEDNVDFTKLLIIVGISPTVIPQHGSGAADSSSFS